MDNSSRPTDAPHERLHSFTTRETGRLGRGYTRFVRAMRVILPLAAVGLVGLVIAWPDMEKRVEPLRKEELIPDSAANMENELIKPTFQSIDDKEQPFTITADLATQSRDNPDIVNLENPVGDLSMDDGASLAVKAQSGIYQQKDEKLYLKGLVKLSHNSGYTLESEEMRVNMKTREAFSDMDVYVQGPDGTIQATGLEAFSQKGLLIFKGPAKMVLTQAGQSLSLGKVVPE
jgi:lipopolysaccharide export system protein LptC